MKERERYVQGLCSITKRQRRGGRSTNVLAKNKQRKKKETLERKVGWMVGWAASFEEGK